MKTAILLCGLGSLLALCGTAQTQISRTRNHNLNISTRGDADSCADLKVTSDGQLAQGEEKFTLSRSEAPTLELNAGDRGVVSVKGWKQSGYSVDVCKIAVAEDRGTADSMLRGIALTHSAGRFSYTGPTADTGTWQVHFIIHTPDTASLDLETRNAPVSIADVNGNIKVRATNGPLAIRGSMGNIDAQTTNGPISFDGEGGEVHLSAQNGPISVKVQKEIWNGSKLEAQHGQRADERVAARGVPVGNARRGLGPRADELPARRVRARLHKLERRSEGDADEWVERDRSHHDTQRAAIGECGEEQESVVIFTLRQQRFLFSSHS